VGATATAFPLRSRMAFASSSSNSSKQIRTGFEVEGERATLAS
jgi:hypothetical protein